MECQLQFNLKNCSCTYPGCPRRGKCCDCLSYHRKKKELPACFFPAEVEATYDRSFRKFIETNQPLVNS